MSLLGWWAAMAINVIMGLSALLGGFLLRYSDFCLTTTQLDYAARIGRWWNVAYWLSAAYHAVLVVYLFSVLRVFQKPKGGEERR